MSRKKNISKWEWWDSHGVWQTNIKVWFEKPQVRAAQNTQLICIFIVLLSNASHSWGIAGIVGVLIWCKQRVSWMQIICRAQSMKWSVSFHLRGQTLFHSHTAEWGCCKPRNLLALTGRKGQTRGRISENELRSSFYATAVHIILAEDWRSRRRTFHTWIRRMHKLTRQYTVKFCLPVL